MHGDDQENKGFKGLGGLSGKPVPPPPPAPIPHPVQDSPPAPPGPGASPSGSGQSSSPSAPKKGGCQGCLIAFLVVSAVGIVLLLLLSLLGHLLAPAGEGGGNDSGAESALVPEVERAHTTMHVVAENAEVRAEAGANSALLATLPRETELRRFGDPIRTPGSEPEWERVEFEQDGRTRQGYVLGSALREGTARDAYLADCKASGIARPRSGEVLRQADRGGHTLKIDAGSSDVLIKLRQDDETVLAFYVRAGESGAVEDVADGEYQIMFATGSEFSPECLTFTSGLNVSGDSNPLKMEPTYEDGSMYYSIVTYTLTMQQGGNFRPEAVDPEAFRE